MKNLIILLFLCFSLVSTATDYYVKNGGSDSNSGLSDDQAWAHHPWMTGWGGNVTLRAGDNVYMKRNGSWSISSPSTNFLTVAQSGSPDGLMRKHKNPL